MDIVEIRVIALVALLGGMGLVSFFLGWLLGKKSAARTHATLRLESHDCDNAETVVTLIDGSPDAICAHVYPDGATIDPQPPDACGLVQPTGTGTYTITGVGQGETGNVRVVVWTVDTNIDASTTCGGSRGGRAQRSGIAGSGTNGGGGTDTGTDVGTWKGSGIGTGIGP